MCHDVLQKVFSKLNEFESFMFDLTVTSSLYKVSVRLVWSRLVPKIIVLILDSLRIFFVMVFCLCNREATSSFVSLSIRRPRPLLALLLCPLKLLYFVSQWQKKRLPCFSGVQPDATYPDDMEWICLLSIQDLSHHCGTERWNRLSVLRTK